MSVFIVCTKKYDGKTRFVASRVSLCYFCSINGELVINFAAYHILCKFEEEANLNTFVGSSLRGAFGVALKKATCTVFKKECETCIVGTHCLYAQFFCQNDFKNTQSHAHFQYPYIIEPPIDKKQFYKQGECFEFVLILFGDYYKYLPFFVYAFECMGNNGIGKINNDNKHARFKIQEIKIIHDNESINIYNEKEQKLLALPEPDRYSYVPVSSENKDNPCCVTVNLLTPLRFKAENQISSDLSFEQLFKLMYRRLIALNTRYGGSQIEIDYKTLLEKAKQAQTLENNTVWESHTRFSHKQNAKLKLSGLTGSLVYKCERDEFLPLFDMASLFHIGKQTSFGLGKISYAFG